jgi:hypothetical protein
VRDDQGAVVVIVRGTTALARWTVTGDGRPGLAVVDELARLHLAAQRMGWALRVERACPRLRELVELAGLVEVLGEPEGDDESAVDEIVVPDDPSA